MVTIRGAACGLKAYIQLGVAWFPKGIIYDTAIATPVPCILQHDTIHFGLGRPDTCYPSHMTQGTNPHSPEVGARGGWDLWEAGFQY